MSLLIRRCNAVTMEGPPGVRTGAAMDHVVVRENVDVLVRGGRIESIGDGLTVPPNVQVIDAFGDVLIPGFVDCHTHLCWSGSRVDEWRRRLGGEAYLDILKSGGGIMSTVRAVRETPSAALAERVRARLDVHLRHGVTTVEVKSGYGLSTEAELKMLRAVRDASRGWPGTVVITALLGHALDPDVPPQAFIERTINETLPAVHAEFPGITVDAFCEDGAWSLADATRLLETARELGHPVRVHADQFTSRGMVGEAIRLAALSVDHLEHSTPGDLAALARSQTFGVGLPITALHLASRGPDASLLVRSANLRALCDAGGRVCIATNANPGSSPTHSMPLAIALGVRLCGLTINEAIVAATLNPALLLGLKDRGVLAPGRRADLVLLRCRDYRELAYELGGDPVRAVVAGGNVIRYYASGS